MRVLDRRLTLNGVGIIKGNVFFFNKMFRWGKTKKTKNSHNNRWWIYVWEQSILVIALLKYAWGTFLNGEVLLLMCCTSEGSEQSFCVVQVTRFTGRARTKPLLLCTHNFSHLHLSQQTQQQIVWIINTQTKWHNWGSLSF